jgi:hypothetical protein
MYRWTACVTSPAPAARSLRCTAAARQSIQPVARASCTQEPACPPALSCAYDLDTRLRSGADARHQHTAPASSRPAARTHAPVEAQVRGDALPPGAARAREQRRVHGQRVDMVLQPACRRRVSCCCCVHALSCAAAYHCALRMMRTYSKRNSTRNASAALFATAFHSVAWSMP